MRVETPSEHQVHSNQFKVQIACMNIKFQFDLNQFRVQTLCKNIKFQLNPRQFRVASAQQKAHISDQYKSIQGSQHLSELSSNPSTHGGQCAHDGHSQHWQCSRVSGAHSIHIDHSTHSDRTNSAPQNVQSSRMFRAAERAALNSAAYLISFEIKWDVMRWLYKIPTHSTNTSLPFGDPPAGHLKYYYEG